MRTDITDENAPPGTLFVAQNVRYGKAGGIFARPGTELQSSTTHGNTHEIQGVSSLSYLGRLGDAALLGTSEGKNFSLDSEGVFNFCGRSSTVVPLRKRQGLLTERSGSIASDRYAVAASASGYVLVASCDGAQNLSVSVEAPDGTRIIDQMSVTTATKCAAIAIGDTFVILSQASAVLTAHTITMTAGAAAYNSAGVATLQSSSQYWDICVGPGSAWYLLYQVTAAQLELLRFNTSLSLTGSLVTIAVTGNCPCSIFYDATNARIWAGWWNNPGVTGEVRLQAYNASGTSLCAVTTLATSTTARPPLIGMPGAVGSAFFTYNRVGTRCVYGYVTLPANAANVCTQASSSAWWVYAVSKPDSQQRSWCETIRTTWSSPTSGQSYTSGDTVIQRMVLLGFHRNAVTGTVTIELSGPEYETGDFSLLVIDKFAPVSEVDGVHTFALTRVLRSLGGAVLLSLEVYQYEDMTAHPWRSVVNLGSSIVVAGQPTALFGRSRGIGNLSGAAVEPELGGVEIGFAMAPQIITVAESALGSLTSLGTYSYQAVFEWITNGERHQSAPSAPIAITLTGVNVGVDLTISTPNWGQRWDDTGTSYAVMHLYRTEDGGAVHWRVTPANGAPVAYDSTDGIISYHDDTSDALALLAGDALYTDQALVDYNLAPSCRFMWRDERRIWFGGLWEADQVACSLDLMPERPIESSDFAGLNGPAYRVLVGEPVTGGAYQDGINYVFARRAIYAFSGDGPDRQANGEFSKPRVLTRETGCKDYRSVLVTSRGIFFQSDRGIELIPRGGGNPVFVGAGIQEITYSNQYSECLGAAVHSDTRGRQARFLMRNSGGATIVAEFDLDLGAWSYSTYYANFSVIGEWPAGTALGFADQSENVCALVEENDSTSYQDGGGGTITMALQTHVMRPFGLAGFGRYNSAILVFSKTNDNDTIALTSRVDGSNVSDNWTLTGTADADYRELTVCRECTAFDFTISCVRAASLRTLVIHGITLELQPLPGARRNPATSQ